MKIRFSIVALLLTTAALIVGCADNTQEAAPQPLSEPTLLMFYTDN